MAKSTKSLRSPNRFLASLRPTDFEVLRPHLKHVELVHEVVLYKTGDNIDRVYFPHSGIISLVVDLAGGQMIEAAMIGRDSMPVWLVSAGRPDFIEQGDCSTRRRRSDPRRCGSP